MRIKASGRSIGAGVAGVTVAAASAIMIVGSPSASATVDTITISSSTPAIGNTYTLHADLSGASVGLLIYWSDNGTSLTPVGKVPWPPGQASLDWTPSTPGQHVLTASQGSSTNTLVVTVGDGSTPTTPPTTTTAPPTTVPPTTAPPTTTPPTTQPTTPATTTTPSGGSGSSGSGTGSAGKLLGGLLGSS